MGGNAISQATAQFMPLIDFYYNTNIDKKKSWLGVVMKLLLISYQEQRLVVSFNLHKGSIVPTFVEFTHSFLYTSRFLEFMLVSFAPLLHRIGNDCTGNGQNNGISSGYFDSLPSSRFEGFIWGHSNLISSQIPSIIITCIFSATTLASFHAAGTTE